MKNKLYPILIIAVCCVSQAKAQVQANKQLQMTGTTEADRRITGVGTAADSADAVNAISLQSNRLTYAIATANGKTYNVALKLAPTQYDAGMMVSFKTSSASMGNDSININGLGTKALLKNVSDALLPNDIAANQMVSAIYDGTAFQVISQMKAATSFSGALSGEITGTQSTTLIAPAAVTTGKVADSAITDSKIAPGISYSKLTGAPVALPPTGAASGDLSGMYPSPTLGAAVVTTAKIADNAVTNEKINSVAYSKITGAPAALPPTGAASGDLSGIYPNPTVATGAINASKIADAVIANNHISNSANIAYSKLNLSNSIVSADITNDAVTTSKIADAAVTNAKLAGGITYSKLVLGNSIVSGDITDNAVTTPKVLDGAITDAKLAGGISYSKLILANSIANGDLTNNAVSTDKVADGAITDAKIASGISYSKLIGAPTALPPTGVAAGDLSGTYPNPTLANAAVTNSKIADNAITTNKINTTGASNGNALVYDGTNVVWAVPTATPTGAAAGDLSGTYPNPTIATAAVTASKIASGSISNAHVSAGANISYSKLNLANSIVGPDITNDAITTSKILNGAVTASKISGSGASSGQVLTYSGTTVGWGTISTSPTGAAGGDLAGSYPNPTVGNGTITSAKISDGTITNADVNSSAAIAYSKLNLTNSIVNADLTNSAVTTNTINDAAVTTAKIADGSVTDSKIASGISYSKLIGTPSSFAPSGAAGGDLSGTYPNPIIGTDAITTVKISDNAVTSNKISDASITTSKINDGAVTTSKINTAGASNGQVLTYDGTSAAWATPIAGGTSLQYHGTITGAASYSSGATVNFSNVLTNTGSQMNTSTGVFTATAAGLYQFSASLPSLGADARFLAVRINGLDVFTGSTGTAITAPSPYNATITPLSLSLTYPLDASDQVEIVLYNNAGTAVPVTTGASRLLITKLN